MYRLSPVSGKSISLDSSPGAASEGALLVHLQGVGRKCGSSSHQLPDALPETSQEGSSECGHQLGLPEVLKIWKLK